MIDQTQCSTLSFWTRFTLNPSSIINHQLLVVVFFTTSMFAVDVKVLPQLFSSELSTQSFTWSHLYWLGIHWPSWQVNWSDPHVCPPGGESYLLTLLSKNLPLCPGVVHFIGIPQVLCSSEPSLQSSSPSQTKPKEMHSPLVTHLNSCELHDGGAATRTQNNKKVKSFVIVIMMVTSYGSDSRQAYAVFLYSDFLKPQLVGYKNNKLTTVQLIRVIRAVFCPVTPPLYVDALSVGALKLPAATASCRKHKKKTWRKKKNLIKHFCGLVKCRVSWGKLELQRSIKHLMWFKWRWMIVGPLNVRCSCVVFFFNLKEVLFQCLFDQSLTVFMAAGVILHTAAAQMQVMWFGL